MKQFLFAAALVALFASVGTAEDAPVVVVGAPVTAASPVMTGTRMVESAPTQSTRRGLFGRMRGRNTTPTPMTAPAMMTAPTMTPSMPMPMPVARASGAAVMPMPMPPSGVTVASGTVIDTNVVTVGYTEVMPATYTEPAMTTQPTTRRGLFGRLRNR